MRVRSSVVSRQRGVGFGYVLILTGLLLGLGVFASRSSSHHSASVPAAHATAGALLHQSTQLRDDVAFAFDAMKATAYSNLGVARHPACYSAALYLDLDDANGAKAATYSGGLQLKASEFIPCAPRLLRTSITGPLGTNSAPIFWQFGMYYDEQPSVYGWTSANVSFGSCLQVNKLLRGGTVEPGPAGMVFPAAFALRSHSLTAVESAALQIALAGQSSACVQDGTGYRLVSRLY